MRVWKDIRAEEGVEGHWKRGGGVDGTEGGSEEGVEGRKQPGGGVARTRSGRGRLRKA